MGEGGVEWTGNLRQGGRGRRDRPWGMGGAKDIMDRRKDMGEGRVESIGDKVFGREG